MIGRYTTRAVCLGIEDTYLTFTMVPCSVQHTPAACGHEGTAEPLTEDGHHSRMPIGDPQGGFFEYTVEGIPESIFAGSVPVSDLERSIGFYTDVLRLDLLGRTETEAYLRRGNCRLILRASDVTGVDTGLYFGVDSPFNTRRRLIDEDVEFVREPVHTPFGTCTSFLDPDGNVLHAIDAGAEFRI